MANANQDPWQTGRPWQIVRADLDLAHVFLPLSRFNFAPVTRPDGVTGYTIAHTYQPPHPDCFANCFLRPAGSNQPSFEKITNLKALPAYDKDSATTYADISGTIAEYMDRDSDVKRLEGIIRVPCHATLPNDNGTGHAPLWIKTLIHVYQFQNVVGGDHPLLLLRAPLSPLCPTNGDGTAIGWS